ncbi:MAG: flagellar basal body rod protein FlgB [Rickettsia sp.]|nr:flagellar basal body rod protein FlgB [Rickettsia sp.]
MKILVFLNSKIFLSLLLISLFDRPLYAKNFSKLKYQSNSFDLTKKKLHHFSDRHKILSKNIANVNTPNYKAEDINLSKDSKIFKKKINNFKLLRTSKMHFSGKNYLEQKRRVKKVSTSETKPNGNNVSIEEELPKISQNSNEYNSALKIYSTLNTLISTVINSR